MLVVRNVQYNINEIKYSFTMFNTYYVFIYCFKNCSDEENNIIL